MHKLASILIILLYLPIQVAFSSQINVHEDEDAQASCIQQLIAKCINKCESADDTHCTQLCAENAKNECRQAGQ